MVQYLQSSLSDSSTERRTKRERKRVRTRAAIKKEMIVGSSFETKSIAGILGIISGEAKLGEGSRKRGDGKRDGEKEGREGCLLPDRAVIQWQTKLRPKAFIRENSGRGRYGGIGRKGEIRSEAENYGGENFCFAVKMRTSDERKRLLMAIADCGVATAEQEGEGREGKGGMPQARKGVAIGRSLREGEGPRTTATEDATEKRDKGLLTT